MINRLIKIIAIKCSNIYSPDVADQVVRRHLILSVLVVSSAAASRVGFVLVLTGRTLVAAVPSLSMTE